MLLQRQGSIRLMHGFSIELSIILAICGELELWQPIWKSWKNNTFWHWERPRNLYASWFNFFVYFPVFSNPVFQHKALLVDVITIISMMNYYMGAVQCIGSDVSLLIFNILLASAWPLVGTQLMCHKFAMAWIRAVRHRTAVPHSSYDLLCMLEWSLSGHCSVCINHSAQNFKGWLRKTLNRRHCHLNWPALCAGLLCCNFFDMLTPVPYHHFFSSLILLFIYV